jgi:hypothetical protein
MSQSNPLAEAYGIGQSMWLDYSGNRSRRIGTRTV